ncbi:SGNH/GDSL hydrolase family protein [Dyella sp.]|uniref:SGNH/GDSL hydrolase family protein n=1 Tax=Dyella sp. TaxID=1869338 RepID=UPI002ED57B1C
MIGKAILLLSMGLLGMSESASALAAGQRVALWSPAMAPGGPALDDQTVRMTVHPSVAGSQLRIHLSNRYGDQPLTLGAVTIALQERDSSATKGSMRAVTVGRAKSITIAAGEDIVSDPVDLSVAAGQNLLVSIYIRHAGGGSTWHGDAFDTTYLMPGGSGDHAAEITMPAGRKTSTSWYVLSGVDAVSTVPGTVVAFGDSITDGYNTPKGAYARWPDFLARRLAASNMPMAVVDAGISGNRVLNRVHGDASGVSALDRFAHDALEQPGVGAVILMEGINDIGNNAGPDGKPLTSHALIEAYRQIIRQAHAHGVRILGGTILPDEGAGYYSRAGEAIRVACNQWIRESGAFDGVVDFDSAIRDPSHPGRMRSVYDSGDHLHPNAAGMQAMANAIDLKLLRRSVSQPIRY